MVLVWSSAACERHVEFDLTCVQNILLKTRPKSIEVELRRRRQKFERGGLSHGLLHHQKLKAELGLRSVEDLMSWDDYYCLIALMIEHMRGTQFLPLGVDVIENILLTIRYNRVNREVKFKNMFKNNMKKLSISEHITHSLREKITHSLRRNITHRQLYVSSPYLHIHTCKMSHPYGVPTNHARVTHTNREFAHSTRTFTAAFLLCRSFIELRIDADLSQWSQESLPTPQNRCSSQYVETRVTLHPCSYPYSSPCRGSRTRKGFGRFGKRFELLTQHLWQPLILRYSLYRILLFTY